jgi:biopolymer transport protein ExbD
MAGGIKQSSGADEDDLDVNHEINVTPFIDVMLVLLIIFMVAAPLSTVDVNVDLPASNAPAAPRPDEPVFVTVRSDLTLAIGNDDIAPERLGPALDALTEGDKEARIFLRADQSVAYGELMGVMNLLREAGYLRIGLVGLESIAAQDAPPAAEPDAQDLPQTLP